MIETNYYARVSYRGKEKDYIVVAEEDNDIRIEYLDYNPEREWDGVWIRKGKNRIITVYSEDSEEAKYYKTLNDEWDKNIKELEKQSERIYGTVSLGTDHYKQAYKKAVKTLKLAEKHLKEKNDTNRNIFNTNNTLDS